MDATQLGRRNLKPDQLSWLRGRRHSRTKLTMAQAGAMKGKALSKLDKAHTAESLAKEHGVNPHRDLRQVPPAVPGGLQCFRKGSAGNFQKAHPSNRPK